VAEVGAWISAVAGVSITLGCAAVWWVSGWIGSRGGERRFLKAYFAGMAVRLGLAGGLSAWALGAWRVRTGVFLAALMGSYSALLAAEVWWLARRGAAQGLRR
jgi:MFS family permease